MIIFYFCNILKDKRYNIEILKGISTLLYFSLCKSSAWAGVLLTCVSNIFCVDYSLAASGIFLVFMF